MLKITKIVESCDTLIILQDKTFLENFLRKFFEERKISEGEKQIFY